MIEQQEPDPRLVEMVRQLENDMDDHVLELEYLLQDEKKRTKRLERDVLTLQIIAASWFVLVVWMVLR